MASMSSLQTIFPSNSAKQFAVFGNSSSPSSSISTVLTWNRSERTKKRRPPTVVAAVGDVSADGTNYLIAGAAAVALLGTAFPLIFSRKDTCPECDGAGFIRKGGVALRANAARKDQAQIVCPNCSGLGKLNQVDK